MVLKIHVKYLCADLPIPKVLVICFPTKLLYAVTRGIRNPCPNPGVKVPLLNCKELVVTFHILIVLVEASLEISAYISLYILHFLILKGESRENCI